MSHTTRSGNTYPPPSGPSREVPSNITEEPQQEPEDPDIVPPHQEPSNAPSENPPNIEQPPVMEQPGNMANALAQLSQVLSNMNQAPAEPSSRIKIKDPEPFDGSDPRKLTRFLTQCRLQFRDSPTTFADESRKVNFALSYLKGLAFDYFEPYFSDSIEHIPDWIDNWDLFVRELKTNFGPFDDSGTAEDEIENVVMRDNTKIADYITRFTAIRVRLPSDYGSGSIRHRFYHGLPERLKDDITRSPFGKPKTLDETIELAKKFDARYWQRQGEVQRKEAVKRAIVKTLDHGRPAVSHGQSSASARNPPRREENRFPKASTSQHQSGSRNSPAPAHQPSPTKSLEGKLTKDGRITAKEKQYRMDNNLCLYCGGKGHRASDCHLSKSNAAKARASAAAPPSPSVPAKEVPSPSEPKKD